MKLQSLLILCVCFSSMLIAVSRGAEPLDIGSRKQLLVDDYLIAAQKGVRRVMHAAKKSNDGQPVRFWRTDADGKRVPLLASIYASPMYDAKRGVFRMWSRVYPGLTEEQALEGSAVHKFMRYGYSESKDGLDFEFVSELRGLHSSGDYNSVVTYDEHESDPAHRYKIGYDGARGGVPNGACLAHSADGIEWTPYNNGNPVTGRAADFTNCLIWDEAARTYRLFTRTDYGSAGGAGEIRGMRVMTNPNVKANPTGWTTIRQWKFDREGPEEHRRRQIYTMTDWIYCDVHFGLFSVYEWPNDFREGTRTDHVKRHERDVLNYYIATSRDGESWDLQWIYSGQPLVERGGYRAWDKDMVLPANWILTHDNRHWIYYGGANERHGTGGVFQPRRNWGIGLATLRLDGFVSINAPLSGGELITKPIKFSGKTLSLNFACSAVGDIRVEIQDPAGKPIPGFALADATELVGDEISRTYSWKSGTDVSQLSGKTVRLRFVLKDADLYSFQFTQAKKQGDAKRELRRDRFLLLDSRLIEKADGAKLTLGIVKKHPANPLIVEDRPWEKRFDNLYGNVLYDAEAKLYKCWYSPFIVDNSAKGMTLEERDSQRYRPPRGREMGICYATSKDGIHWEKPELGLVEYEGSNANNLVWRGPHGAGIFKDDHDPDPKRRFKMFMQGLKTSYSADGIHWSEAKRIDGVRVPGDTHNNMFWHPESEKYVGITRTWNDKGRAVYRIESSDFQGKWEVKPGVVMEALSRGDQPYAMPVFRHGGVYLGLLASFGQNDRTRSKLAWSPDTITWHRIDPDACLIPNSEKRLDYDYGCIYACAYPIFLENEIRLYYGGSDYKHGGWRTGNLSLATLRPDGFAGYEPQDPTKPAVVTTKPIPYDGRPIRITADVNPGGTLKVSAIDADGKTTTAAKPITKTVTDQPLDITTESDAGTIRLKFELDAAKVYSFSFPAK